MKDSECVLRATGPPWCVLIYSLHREEDLFIVLIMTGCVNKTTYVSHISSCLCQAWKGPYCREKRNFIGLSWLNWALIFISMCSTVLLCTQLEAGGLTPSKLQLSPWKGRFYRWFLIWALSHHRDVLLSELFASSVKKACMYTLTTKDVEMMLLLNSYMIRSENREDVSIGLSVWTLWNHSERFQ